MDAKLSRREINLRRLLTKCELKIKCKEKDDKLPQFAGTLVSMLAELQQSDLVVTCALDEYRQRIAKIHQHVFGLEDTLEPPSALNSSSLTDREQLLGKSTAAGQTDAGNSANLIRNQLDLQEKISHDMLMFAGNLKMQTELASKIIKKDIEVVGKSTELTDSNMTKLKTASVKLDEHSRRACKCWMWSILFIVMVVFIFMVLFMKIMKKKQNI